MVEAVRSFEKEEIDRLQSMLEVTRDQLETTEIKAAGVRLDSVEQNLLTRVERRRDKVDMTKTAFMLAGVALISLVMGLIASGVL